MEKRREMRKEQDGGKEEDGGKEGDDGRREIRWSRCQPCRRPSMS